MHLTATGNALFSKTQQRVLGLLFGSPGQRYYTNEIVRLADMGRGTVGRELDRLEAIGLINSTREGNQRYYQANPASPLFQEVVSIIRKTSGVDAIVAEALEPFREQISVAFIYGAIASGRETVDSPVELFIAAEKLAYGEVMLPLNEASRLAGRPIKPSIYSRQHLRRELLKSNAFLNRVFRHPKLWVVGDDKALGELRRLAKA